MTEASPKKTPLYSLHDELGGRLVPFAGYAMPLQFPAGIMAEHLHVREHAGLFDVSHMGQVRLTGIEGDPAAALESLVPGALQVLKPGRMRYSLLLNDAGGIMDDLMVTRISDSELFVVVNAACKDEDCAYMAERLGGSVALERLDDHALLALQGPEAVAVIDGLIPGVGDLDFMSGASFDWDGTSLFISRCGYTGEDGVEISVPGERAEALARTLLADKRVLPIGLGARDSLRLEAGLCLYGHDLDQTTSPVEGSLVFAMGKKRRDVGDFPGGERILAELANGPSRMRVGLRLKGRAPAREGAEITDADGTVVGRVTSGGFGPTVQGPIAMGYVPPHLAEPGTPLGLVVRGRTLEAEVAALPFVAQRYVRKTQATKP